MEQSEFGKGLVICLVKFAEHLADYRHWVELNETVTHANDAEEMYFNAASDHLYEIQVPKSLKHTELARKVKELQDMALEIGLGFTGKKYSNKDVEHAMKLTHEIALLVDKQLGLNAEEGQW